MRNWDIKEDELLHLPVCLRIGPHQQHSEDGERLFCEQYQPVMLADHQVDQALRWGGAGLAERKGQPGPEPGQFAGAEGGR